MPEIPARRLQSVRPHVLFVEDDRAVRDAARMLLVVEGAGVGSSMPPRTFLSAFPLVRARQQAGRLLLRR